MIAPAVTQIASQLAGEPVSISCERNQRFQGEEKAYTLYADNGTGAVVFSPVIHLSASTCNALNRLVARDRRHVAREQIATNGGAIVDIEDGSAIHLLEHEALHIRMDSTDEALVECTAEKNRWTAIKAFGLAAWQDNQILRGFVVAHRESDPSYLAVC